MNNLYDFQIGESVRINYSGWIRPCDGFSYYLIQAEPLEEDGDHNIVPKGTVAKIVKLEDSVLWIDISTRDYDPILIWSEGISPMSPLEKLAECCE